MNRSDPEVVAIIARYPEGRSRSALLPLTHLVQRRDGYVTPEGIAQVADVLELTLAEVRSVISFYTMFHLRPTGRHTVSVCHNIACSMRGAESVISALESRLGVECGATSEDGEITLERAECLAACDLAPMLQIDYDEVVGPLTPESAASIIDRLISPPRRAMASETDAESRASEGGLFDAGGDTA